MNSIAANPRTGKIAVAVSAIAVSALLLGACGSSGSSSSTSTSMSGSSSSSSSQTTTATASAIPDPCTLVTNADLTSLTGSALALNPPTDSANVRSCTWGSLTSDTGLVSVLISKSNSSGTDMGDVLYTSSGEKGTTVTVANDGKIVSRGIIAGGGGAGKTVIFHKSGLTVLVAVVGSDVSQESLVSAAQNVAAGIK